MKQIGHLSLPASIPVAGFLLPDGRIIVTKPQHLDDPERLERHRKLRKKQLESNRRWRLSKTPVDAGLWVI